MTKVAISSQNYNIKEHQNPELLVQRQSWLRLMTVKELFHCHQVRNDETTAEQSWEIPGVCWQADLAVLTFSVFKRDSHPLWVWDTFRLKYTVAHTQAPATSFSYIAAIWNGLFSINLHFPMMSLAESTSALARKQNTTVGGRAFPLSVTLTREASGHSLSSDGTYPFRGHAGLEPIQTDVGEAGVHAGQVGGLSRGWHIETNNLSRSHSHLQAI